jgi:ABC-2 type transport system ATP-binding protein
MSQAKLIVENLTVRYGEFLAVNELNFQVEEGEILGMLGPNGAGKSTTIKAILGLIPFEGNIRIAEEDAGSMNVRKKIGYMPQSFSLYQNLTVQENMRFFAAIYGVAKSDVERRIDELLQIVELERWKDKVVKNLSGGMKQRLMLACSMIHEPEIMILDEPTAGVDPPLRRAFWDHFRELNEEGKTILVTTHYMDEAENCHRLIVMRNGVKIAEGGADEIKRRALGGELILIDSVNKQEVVRILTGFGFDSTVVEGKVAVLAENSAKTLPEVMEILRKHNVPITYAETKKLTLEDAFLKFIGGDNDF